MSQIYRQGNNWVIVDYLSSVEFTNEVLNSVYEKNWAEHTSAKGINSTQNYIINPSWMPDEGHKEPKGWENLKNIYENIVQKEIVNYGLMPYDWGKLQAKSAWIVTGSEGSYHTAHEHGPSNICSVTYIDVPEKKQDKAGEIFFIMHCDSYSQLSPPNFRTLHIQPQKGMIVIFPSWMIHGVYPQSVGVRKTLNIDFNGDPNFKGISPQSSTVSYG
jgi:hypothetical protein